MIRASVFINLIVSLNNGTTSGCLKRRLGHACNYCLNACQYFALGHDKFLRKPDCIEMMLFDKREHQVKQALAASPKDPLIPTSINDGSSGNGRATRDYKKMSVCIICM